MGTPPEIEDKYAGTFDKRKFEPGIYDNYPAEDYHREKALSCSGLKKLARSPAHFKCWQDNPKPSTASQIFGTCFHLAVLEPNRFFDEVLVYEGRKYGSKWDAFQSANPRKTILSIDDYNAILAMKKSVMDSEIASNLIKGALFEQSVFWNEPTFDFPCKCRPDILRPDLEVVADLKSCGDASQNGFSIEAGKNKYHYQAPWYLLGVNSVFPDKFYKTFLFICTEAEPPYLTKVHNAAGIVEKGRERIRPLVEVYAECIEKDEWPGYDDNIDDMWVSEWA